MLHAHKQALERDLEDEKQRLAQLREARNSANHESLALRRDRKYLIAELRFLRHMAEEEEGLILVLQNSNQYLEASRGTLEASSAALAKISAEAQCKSFDWLTRLTPPTIRCLIPVVPLVGKFEIMVTAGS